MLQKRARSRVKLLEKIFVFFIYYKDVKLYLERKSLLFNDCVIRDTLNLNELFNSLK